MTEVWRPVVDYEGFYEVSDEGNVRSLDREVTDRNGKTIKLPGRPLARCRHNAGYWIVVLSRDNIRDLRLVHRLVLEAFVGPPGEGDDACHYDGDRENARLDNLRWDTRSSNHMDKVRHGTHIRGERHHKVKLTREQVMEIYRLANANVSQRELAARFGIGQMQVSRIKRGINWGWMTKAA